MLIKCLLPFDFLFTRVGVLEALKGHASSEWGNACAHSWICTRGWGDSGRKHSIWHHRRSDNPSVVGGEQSEMADAPIATEWVVVLINRHRNHIPAPQWSELHRIPQGPELRSSPETLALASFHTSVSLAKSSHKAIDFFFSSPKHSFSGLIGRKIGIRKQQTATQNFRFVSRVCLHRASN